MNPIATYSRIATAERIEWTELLQSKREMIYCGLDVRMILPQGDSVPVLPKSNTRWKVERRHQDAHNDHATFI